MTKRTIGPFSVEPIGLGCMSLSHAYGVPPAREDAQKLLHRALDIGVDFLDTAALYGFGANEKLVGETLKGRRSEFTLASKCGMKGVNGVRVIDGRPETLKETIDESLANLQTDVIDLYYLHRRDFSVPIEDSVGALAEMVKAGKVRAIGLSEISADTLRKAHAVHPIAAVQNEYSPWSRNVELGVLRACEELGVALVAFSPVARGFLAGGVSDAAALAEKDIRRGMPRFQGDNFTANLKLFDAFKALADEAGCTPAQLCLAWLLAKGDNIIPIPGTTSIAHLEEDFAARSIRLEADIVERVDTLVNQRTVAGPRYPAGTQKEIDTEEYA